MIGGGSSGKTEAGAFEALNWMIDNPGCVGAVFAPSYKMIHRNIIPKFEKLLGVSYVEASPFVDSFHKTNMVLTFNTFVGKDRLRQSKLWLVGLERPEAAEGMNLDFAWLDEAGLVPKLEPARRSIMRRLRGSGTATRRPRSKVPKNAVGMWVTTTPPFNALSSDLYFFFEHPTKKNPDSKVYPMSLYDNRDNLPPGYIEEAERIHPEGPLRDRYILGKFVDMSGGVFAFVYSVHVDGFWAPDEFSRQMIYGADFGWVSPSAIVAIASDGDGRAFVVDEVYGTQMSEQDIFGECVDLQMRWGRGTFWCDSSRPDTIKAMVRAGIDARPNKSKREDGILELGGRFPDAGDGLRRIYVSPDCVSLIEELQIFNPDRKEHDHACDALRYALMGGKIGGGMIEGYRMRRRR